jgi:hypothetical protein
MVMPVNDMKNEESKINAATNYTTFWCQINNFNQGKR